MGTKNGTNDTNAFFVVLGSLGVCFWSILPTRIAFSPRLDRGGPSRSWLPGTSTKVFVGPLARFVVLFHSFCVVWGLVSAFSFIHRWTDSSPVHVKPVVANPHWGEKQLRHMFCFWRWCWCWCWCWCWLSECLIH
jgi:hypothetical protein